MSARVRWIAGVAALATALAVIAARREAPVSPAAAPAAAAATTARTPAAPSPAPPESAGAAAAEPATPAPAGAAATAVFASVEDAQLPADLDTGFDRSVFRQRFARADASALAASGELDWNLFDDTVHRVVFDRPESDASGARVWRGRVAGDPHSLVVARLDGDRLTASLALSSGALFAVDTLAPHVQRIQEIDPAALPDCGVDAGSVPRAPAADAGGGADGPPASGASPLETEPIDVLMLYTPGARAVFGSASAIESRLALLVDWANAVYANTGSSQRLRRAAALEVAYDDSHHSGSTALDDLTHPGDGQLEGVHALRDQLGADMVALFTSPSNVCGIAWVASSAADIGAYQDYMFSVVNASCTSNPRTFAHELGHNQGAYHDPVTSKLQGMTQQQIDAVPPPNSFGYLAPNNAFHTVMAYASSCGGCAVLQQFSNPDLSYQGLPTGDARSNVRGTLEATHAAIAAFRPAQTCAGQPDADGDGVCDAADNCVDAPNPSQLDANADGYGNACDADYTDDSVVGLPDFHIFEAAFGSPVGTPGVDPETDHTGDGAVGIPDFPAAFRGFGGAPGPSGLAP